MVAGRRGRREQRRDRVARVVGAAKVEPALDALELMDLAWHDCYGDPAPPDRVIDDVLTVADDLAGLVSAALLGVIDFRDLRVAADEARDHDER